jgi:putative oxidoreductase
MDMLKRILDSCWFRFLARLAVGGVFVYASLQKIADPASFAQNIENYRMLPLWSVNFLALYLPWLELLAGVFLVAGVWVRGSALLISSMLGVFIVAIGQAAARGIKLHCGCLSAQGEPADVSGMLLHMLGNAALLALGVMLLRAGPGEEKVA